MNNTRLVTEILIDVRTIKKIAVTCKCGERTVHEIPSILLESRQRVIARCPQCKQAYGVMDGRVIRLSPDLTPDGVNVSRAIPGIKNEQGEQETHQEVFDDGIPFIQGTFTNEDKHVN